MNNLGSTDLNSLFSSLYDPVAISQPVLHLSWVENYTWVDRAGSEVAKTDDYLKNSHPLTKRLNSSGMGILPPCMPKDYFHTYLQKINVQCLVLKAEKETEKCRIPEFIASQV